MDTEPDPRPELTAAQRIAIALGTAEPPAADHAHADAVADAVGEPDPTAEPALIGAVEESDSPA